MNVEELFRRYLEQRREMGESELVLDTLTVDEVLRIVGAQGKRAPAPRDVAAADDWRSVLRGAEAELPRKVERIPAREAPPSSAPRVPAPAPPPAPATPTIAVAQPTPPSPRRGTTALSALAPQGLVVGGGDV